MKCPICGNENLDSTKFCIWCGAPLDTPSASAGNAPEASTSPAQDPGLAPPPVPAPSPIPTPSHGAAPTPSPIPVQTNSYNPVYSAIPQENPSSSFGGSPIPIQPAYSGGAYASPYKSTNVLCIIGFVVSLASILCCGFPAVIGLILSIIGLVFAVKNGEKGKGLAIAGIIVSAILTLFVIFVIASGNFHYSIRLFPNKIDTPEEIEEYVQDNIWIDIDEDTCLEFVSSKKFKYYRDFEETDDYYYEGTYELYIGKEAIEYLEDDLSQYGITEEDVEELAGGSKYYKVENLVVLVLHSEKRYVEGKNDLDETVVTPYIGFFATNDNQHALDMTNLNSFQYYLFVPEDEYEEAKKAN